MLVTLDTGPTTYPVTTADAKKHLRITHAAEDDKIDALIQAASRAIGEMAGRVLTAETWIVSVGAGICGKLYLPKSPVQSVSSIAYYDDDDNVQAGTVSNFYLIADDDRAWLEPKPGFDWPDANVNREDAISVTFIAGYSSCPDTLKQAVLMLVGHFYRNREAVAMGQAPSQVPLAVTDMVNFERLGWTAG